MYRSHPGRKRGNHFRHPQQTLEIPPQSSQIDEGDTPALVADSPPHFRDILQLGFRQSPFLRLGLEQLRGASQT
jgi:hypothetical protein